MKSDILFLAFSVALPTTSSFAAASSSAATISTHPAFQSVTTVSSLTSPLLLYRRVTKRRSEFRRFASSSSHDDDDNNNNNNNNNNMVEFFSTHNEWKPLFRNIMCSKRSAALASSLLSLNNSGQERSSTASTTMNLWGLSTLEQRHPWRLLPSKPTLDTSLHALSNFLDAWQQSLLDIPLDELITGENDLRFLEEGRRTIAVTRFHVLDEYYSANNSNSNYGSSSNSEGIEEVGESGSYIYDWEMELFRTCWSEVAHLMHQDSSDTGALVLLPDWINKGILDGSSRRGSSSVGNNEDATGSGLEYVQKFLEEALIQPIAWLGRSEDWEIVAMERGNLAVRLLYKLSDIPDLSKR